MIEARAPGIPMSPRHFFLCFGLPLRSPRREPVYLFLYQSRVMNGRFAPEVTCRAFINAKKWSLVIE